MLPKVFSSISGTLHGAGSATSTGGVVGATVGPSLGYLGRRLQVSKINETVEHFVPKPTFLGCYILVSCYISLGGHRSSNRRVRNVCHENGWNIVFTYFHIRSNHRMRNAQYDRSNYVLLLPFLLRNSWCPTSHIEKTTKQVTSFVFLFQIGIQNQFSETP